MKIRKLLLLAPRSSSRWPPRLAVQSRDEIARYREMRKM